MLYIINKPNVSDIHLLKPMQQFVEFLSSKRGRNLIVGDFNLPGVNWKNLSASSVGKH